MTESPRRHPKRPAEEPIEWCGRAAAWDRPPRTPSRQGPEPRRRGQQLSRSEVCRLRAGVGAVDQSPRQEYSSGVGDFTFGQRPGSTGSRCFVLIWRAFCALANVSAWGRTEQTSKPNCARLLFLVANAATAPSMGHDPRQRLAANVCAMSAPIDRPNRARTTVGLPPYHETRRTFGRASADISARLENWPTRLDLRPTSR